MKLILRVMKFATMEILSQEQVLKTFADLPQVLRGKVGAAVLTLTLEQVQRLLAEPEALTQQLTSLRDTLAAAAESEARPQIWEMPEDLALQPIIADQWAVKNAFNIMTRWKERPKAVAALKQQIATILSRVLHGSFNVTFNPEAGRLHIGGEHFLDGLEAIVWFGLALIFEHNLIQLVRVCRAPVGNEECGKVFFYKPSRRKFCSDAHADLGLRETVRDWHDDRRKSQGLEPFRWGSKPREEKQMSRSREKSSSTKKGRTDGKRK
jgi:hypothetical protein